MAESSNPFGDMFGGGPSGFGTQFPTSRPDAEKGVAWDAKLLGGKLYVPLEQVAELLKNNDILPKMQERINMHIQVQNEKNTLDI